MQYGGQSVTCENTRLITARKWYEARFLHILPNSATVAPTAPFATGPGGWLQLLVSIRLFLLTGVYASGFQYRVNGSVDGCPKRIVRATSVVGIVAVPDPVINGIEIRDRINLRCSRDLVLTGIGIVHPYLSL